MNLLVNTEPGELYFVSSEEIIIDHEKSMINNNHNIDGVPCGDIIQAGTYTIEKIDAGDFDESYQYVDEERSYDNSRNVLTISKSVFDWRTQEEAEAEQAAAAAAAIDVTPDSADSD